MAKKKKKGAPEAPVDAPFDSDKAISACYGVLASVTAAQEAMTEAVQGRLEYKQRQRILVAGMSTEGKAHDLPWEAQRRTLIASGGVVAAGDLGSETLRRDEIEALVAHRAGLAAEKAVGEMRGQSGDIREAVDQAVSQAAGTIEGKLLNIMRENLTDSLRTLEETLEERMREIASAAAERMRVDRALEDARKAAEQGIRAAGGDELLDQIDDVRDVKLDVGDLFVGDIEERSSVTDDLPGDRLSESIADQESPEIEAGEEEIEAGEEEIEAGEEEIEAGEEEIEAGEEEIEAGEEEIEAAEEEIEAGEKEIEAAEEEIEAGEEEIAADEADEFELDLGGEGDADAFEIDVAGDDVELDMDEDIEVSQGLGPDLDDSSADVVVMDSADAGEDEMPADEDFSDEDQEAITRYLDLASKLRDRKNYTAAAELYSKILELDEGSVEAHIGLGAIHLQTPDFEAAAAEFGKALELDTDSPAGFLGMGEVHFLQKDYAAAIKQYSKCIKLDEDLAQAYCNRGLSYHYRKNHKKAFLDLQKAYRLDPDIPNIKKYLQMVMKVLKKKEG